MKSKKRDSIINTSKELLNQFGIDKVSVEEICRKANVSKGTYYKYFSNKDQVVMELVKGFLKDAKERFLILVQQRAVFEKLIEGLIKVKVDFMKEYTEVFLKDLYKSTDEMIQQALLELNKQSLDNVVYVYELGLKEKKINPCVTIEFFLYQLELMDKIRTDERIKKIYPNRDERELIVFQQFLFGITGIKRSMESKN